ncbi:MAG: carboxypeptidase regulatory-like domain-containing protein [Lysobacter sp.]|nr:carboxypeptidase regulatory-like domain-containing protein [Lysobacter sp.]
MTLSQAVALLLACAVVAAGARLLVRFIRAPATERPRALRVVALLLLQGLAAVLLYRTLFPPSVHGPAGLLVVATANADRVPADVVPAGARRVALPEAPALHDAERVPDLATALRHHPGTTRLRIVGAGLTPRDLDAAHDLPVEFIAAPLPAGLVALWPPTSPQAGRAFHVAGRTNDLRDGRVELLDPAGRTTATATAAPDGHFVLSGDAGIAGPATWRVRLRDRAGRVVDDVALPLDVAPGERLRVLVLAGAPNPELKYLRRWASDAGLAMDARIALGGGMAIGNASTTLDAASFARTDLVVLDQRSWQALGTRRAALLQAVRGGLGLLLQLPGATSAGDRATLHALGFDTAVAASKETRLDATPAPGARAEAGAPTLTRGALRIAGMSAVPLLRDADGVPLASWRALGLGRIGVATFDDSYRLVLAGQAQRHHDLWAALSGTLARPRPSTQPMAADDARIDERIVACGLSSAATVVAPGGIRSRLRVDPATGARACAGIWPRVPGWYTLEDGDRAQRFHVRAAADAPGLRAAQLHDATAQVAGALPARESARPGAEVPGTRWPWLLAWLAVAAAGWWLERARVGLPRSAQ